MISQHKEKAPYDAAYILDIERSKDRWNKISESFKEAGIPYQRFEAIDEEDIKLVQLKTKQEFTGKDIKNARFFLSENTAYEVFCTPSVDSKKNFFFIVDDNNFNVRQLGIWCSYHMIWQDIAKNNYQNALVFEDKFVPVKNNFKQNLYQFIGNVPASYDIAYVDALLRPGHSKSISGNGEDFWSGTWAMMFSQKIVSDLLSCKYYIHSLDTFFFKFAEFPTELLGNKKIEAYVSKDKPSGLELYKFIENSKVEEMDSRSSPSNKMLYDAAYIINLERSKDRKEKITYEFDKRGLPYQIFNAVDGYKVTAQDSVTQKKITGEDIKNGISAMDPKIVYQVHCNANESFNLLPIRPLSAGELGYWCSYRIILKDIVKNNYQNTMIFEDDVAFRVDNFARKLNKFIVDMPETYDLAYVGVYQKLGYKIPLNHKEHISKFSSEATWDGSWATLVSNKAAKNLLAAPLNFLAVDNFIFSVATSENLLGYNKLEVYRASENMLWIEGESEIENMGRATPPGYEIIEKNANNIPVMQAYDKMYVINLASSPKRWEKVSSILDKTGVYYSRFNAVDGYKVEIKDVGTNQTYYGSDIKNNTFSMIKDQLYIITCDPQSALPTQYTFLVKKPLLVGEVGVFCSYRMIWIDILTNKYKNTVILEDDFITRTEDFSLKLNRFIEDLPPTYDIAYIDARHYEGTKIPIEGKAHISAFSSDSKWNGLWASVMSLEGAKKMIEFAGFPYVAAVDVCITGLYSTGKLEAYISTEKLADHDGASDICAMGIPNGYVCQSYYGADTEF